MGGHYLQPQLNNEKQSLVTQHHALLVPECSFSIRPDQTKQFNRAYYSTQILHAHRIKIISGVVIFH
jgi:hypothetical protein